MSAQQLISEHIALWTSSIKTKNTQGRGSSKKRELYGIKKLRELIFELAIQGKLVPQNLNDEPASELLKLIAAEKAQLIREKKIKKQKPLGKITDEEKLFDLPAGWEWARLSDAYDVRDGTHDSPKAIEDGIPLVTSKNLSSGKLDLANVNYISIEDHLKIQERSAVEINDVLFAMIGSIGNPVLVDIETEFSIKNVALFKYYNLKFSSPHFLKYFLEHSSRIFREQSSGAVQSFVSLGKIRSFVLALPPLEEQHRIVSKVDELMVLCDQLELKTESSLDAHDLLVDTLLSTLTDARDANDLGDNWARMAKHFDTLITTDYAVEQLKQSILQLAVQGKLVPQNPNDEPAGDLLKRVTAKKEQLIKDKKLKLQKKASHYNAPIAFNSIPDGWITADFGDITFNRDSERIPLSVSDRSARQGQYDYYGASGVIDSIDDYLFDKPLLLIGEDGANLVNRSTPIAFMAYGKYWINNHAHVIDGISEDFLVYLGLYINSISLMPYITGMAQPKMNQAKMNSILVALPPEKEQIRIREKLEYLWNICDQLKIRLNDARTIQIYLTDAVIENALTM
jgi:type I restriction enzyme, S subunit